MLYTHVRTKSRDASVSVCVVYEFINNWRSAVCDRRPMAGNPTMEILFANRGSSRSLAHRDQAVYSASILRTLRYISVILYRIIDCTYVTMRLETTLSVYLLNNFIYSVKTVRPVPMHYSTILFLRTTICAWWNATETLPRIQVEKKFLGNTGAVTTTVKLQQRQFKLA